MRQAADELRAELAGDTVTFVVNRNLNVSNVCIVGCAFCGFGQGRRSPDAYTHEREEFVARIGDAVAYGATELCIQSGIHPGLDARGLRGLAAAGAARPRRSCTCTPTRRWRSRTCATAPGSPRARCSRACATPGLGSVPGHRRRGARRRRAPADQPEQAAGRALGRDRRGRARRRAALDGDGHVRPHRGAARAGRAHARRARAAGAHRRLHRVRAAVVHPVQHAARPHARDRGDLARGEPQAHRGVPARARPQRAEPAGELGQDGPRRRDRGAALGRQRPRRHADGGVDLAPGGLLPRRQARPRRPRRGRAPRRPAGGRAHDALRAAPAGTRSSRPRREREVNVNCGIERSVSTVPWRVSRGHAGRLDRHYAASKRAGVLPWQLPTLPLDVPRSTVTRARAAAGASRRTRASGSRRPAQRRRSARPARARRPPRAAAGGSRRARASR